MSVRSEMLAQAVESYLVNRYPGARLTRIADSSIVNEQDRDLATQLLFWRVDLKWPKPALIGVSRCANCNRPMGDDESSVVEDETVCKKCGPTAADLEAEAADPGRTIDLILIAGSDVKEDADYKWLKRTVERWTPEERRAVQEYCAAVHFKASDNDDVKVPARPAVLDQLSHP